MPRQYASFAGTASGHNVTEFVENLVEHGHATASGGLDNRAEKLYLLHHQALYRAIGEPHSRSRRPVSPRQAIERVMLLDGPVTSPEFISGSRPRRRGRLLSLTAPSLPRERLPHRHPRNALDVLLRIATHPERLIGQLTPKGWAATFGRRAPRSAASDSVLASPRQAVEHGVRRTLTRRLNLRRLSAVELTAMPAVQSRNRFAIDVFDAPSPCAITNG